MVFVMEKLRVIVVHLLKQEMDLDLTILGEQISESCLIAVETTCWPFGCLKMILDSKTKVKLIIWS